MNRYLGGGVIHTAYKPIHLTHNSSGESNVEFQFLPKILFFLLRNCSFYLSTLRHFFSNSTSSLATNYQENYQTAVIVIMHNIDLEWGKPFLSDFNFDMKIQCWLNTKHLSLNNQNIFKAKSFKFDKN